MFGTSTPGEMESMLFKPVELSPSPDRAFVCTATDLYEFLVPFERSCAPLSFDEQTGDDEGAGQRRNRLPGPSQGHRTRDGGVVLTGKRHTN